MHSATFRTRGHPAALEAVARWVRSERAPHALLLSGPDGGGKTTLALDLASGLLCLAADTADRPCRTCSACHKVDHGNHPDIHRIAPQGAGEQIRLAQVQQLISDLALLPMEGRVRVCLIEDAQRLNPDAQNALLKALEEPVGRSCLILAADDTAPLLPTVISRVARLRLGPVPSDITASWLMDRGVPAATARAAARAADGRPGRALMLARNPEIGLARDRLARQLLDLAVADRRTRLGAATELMATGLSLDAPDGDDAGADGERTGGDAGVEGGDGAAGGDAADAAATGSPRVAPATRSGRPARSAKPASRSASSGARLLPADRRRAVSRVLSAWREVGRDLCVMASGGRAAIRRIELLEELEALAPRIDVRDLTEFLDGLDGLEAAIESYASPELVLDALLLRWPRPAGPASSLQGAGSSGRAAVPMGG